MTTREADRPLQRYEEARARSAPLPTTYTTTRGTTPRRRRNIKQHHMKLVALLGNNDFGHRPQLPNLHINLQSVRIQPLLCPGLRRRQALLAPPCPPCLPKKVRKPSLRRAKAVVGNGEVAEPELVEA